MDIVLRGGYVPAGLSVDNKTLLDNHLTNEPSLLFLENKSL